MTFCIENTFYTKKLAALLELCTRTHAKRAQGLGLGADANADQMQRRADSSSTIACHRKALHVGEDNKAS